jgi:hypothetical protein
MESVWCVVQTAMQLRRGEKKMLRKLLDKLPRFEIPQLLDDGSTGVYLRRFFLKGASNSPKWRILLHEIMLSDQGRELHSHPWWFISVGLKVTYKETTLFGVRTFSAPWVIFHHATDFHRLDIDSPKVWTLVITGRKRHHWGFLTKNGFVRWEDYVNEAEHVPENSHQRTQRIDTAPAE